MYKSKPFNSKCVIESYPTVMYKCKSYYGDVDVSPVKPDANDPSLDLNNLNKVQQSQLRRLNRLGDRINQFCDDLSLNYFISQQKSAKDSPLKSQFMSQIVKNKKKSSKIVEDIVIHVSTKKVPYSLLIAFSQLAVKFKCFTQFFLHGSSAKEFKDQKSNEQQEHIKKIMNLVKSLGLDLVDSRSKYDIGVTFVFKKLENEKLGPVLTLNNRSKIYGESNILRYLNRLETNTKELKALNDFDMMDKCTNEFLMSADPKPFLNNLNKNLGSSKFVSIENRVGLVDLYVWSLLMQSQHILNNLKNMNKIVDWKKAVETSSPFIQLLVTEF